MIKQIKIENIEIDGVEENFVSRNISGKILKVMFKLKENVLQQIRLRIFTKEGEEVLNVTDGGVYYPRANIASQKMMVTPMNVVGDKMDYYYFNKGLLFNLTSNSQINKEVVIDKIILIYDGPK